MWVLVGGVGISLVAWGLVLLVGWPALLIVAGAGLYLVAQEMATKPKESRTDDMAARGPFAASRFWRTTS
jgi:hypothetical protein